MSNSIFSKLEFDNAISSFMKETNIRNHIKGIHFYFFNKDQTKIAYQFEQLKTRQMNMKDSKEVFAAYQEIIKKDGILYKIYDNEAAIFLSDKKASVFEDYCCMILMETQESFLYDFMRSYENYLIQTCLNITKNLINYDSIFRIIDTFTEIMSQKDIDMPNHMSNVSILCNKIADKLPLTRDQKFLLRITSLVHDIGKIYIPDEIYNKPSKLDFLEFGKIKEHCIRGEDIVASSFYHINSLDKISSFVRSHHENFDGSGYPDGIKGYDIPIISRIIRVADSVDAMLSNRVYRDSINMENIIDELNKTSGHVFDPDIVNAMIEVLYETTGKRISEIKLEGSLYPKATISFEYLSTDNILSFCGNLVINSDHTALLYLHTVSKTSLENAFIKDDIYNATICIFAEDNLYEFNVDVSDIKENTIYLNNIKYHPTDKYFSMRWDSSIYLKTTDGKDLIGNIINLGADTIVYKLNNDEAQKIMKEINNPLEIELRESLEDIEIRDRLQVKTIRFYLNSDETFFVSRFVSLSSLQRDRIIKLLFRKQMISRRL